MQLGVVYLIIALLPPPPRVIVVALVASLLVQRYSMCIHVLGVCARACGREGCRSFVRACAHAHNTCTRTRMLHAMSTATTSTSHHGCEVGLFRRPPRVVACVHVYRASRACVWAGGRGGRVASSAQHHQGHGPASSLGHARHGPKSGVWCVRGRIVGGGVGTGAYRDRFRVGRLSRRTMFFLNG